MLLCKQTTTNRLTALKLLKAKAEVTAHVDAKGRPYWVAKWYAKVNAA